MALSPSSQSWLGARGGGRLQLPESVPACVSARGVGHAGGCLHEDHADLGARPVSDRRALQLVREPDYGVGEGPGCWPHSEGTLPAPQHSKASTCRGPAPGGGAAGAGITGGADWRGPGVRGQPVSRERPLRQCLQLVPGPCPLPARVSSCGAVEWGAGPLCWEPSFLSLPPNHDATLSPTPLIPLH